MYLRLALNCCSSCLNLRPLGRQGHVSVPDWEPFGKEVVAAPCLLKQCEFYCPPGNSLFLPGDPGDMALPIHRV